MADVWMYDRDSTNSTPLYLRDYLMGRLSSVLVAGQSYCVTFYVVMSEQAGYAIDHIGAYLDNGSIDTVSYCGLPHMEYTPQVYTTTIISDSISWTKIQGSFIANGTEKYITIGNFFDTAHTNKIRMIGESWGSYYQVDDVSVIATGSHAYAGPDVKIPAGSSAWIGVDSNGNGDGMPCYWYVAGNNSPIDSGGRIKVTPADTTTYVVAMDLCGVVTYDTVTVNVAHCTGPVVAAFSDTGALTHGYTYTASTYSMDSVRWDFGDGGNSSVLNPVHTFSASGTYHVCVTMYAVCGVDSACKDIAVHGVGVPIDRLTMTAPVVWPNPAGDELHVDNGAGSALIIYDMVGREVYRSFITSDNDIIDVGSLEKGIYVIHIIERSTGQRYVRKIIKE